MSDDRVVIDGEPAYPIYDIGVRWEQDGEEDPGSHWYAGEGRTKNGTQLHRMYRDDPGEDGVAREITEEWWPEYVEKKLAGVNSTEPTIEVCPVWYETWCCSWFEHWTFDDGRTDREYLESFENYVRRHEDYQDHIRHVEDERSERGEPTICLMGAEDRWRWCGSGDDGKPDTRTDPPCRCEHCREQGVVRIGH